MASLEVWLASSMIGGATGLMAWYGRDAYVRSLDRLEGHFDERLRSFRAANRRLRTWLVIWSIVLLATFLVVGFVLNSLVFAILAVAILTAFPWYLVATSAEKHRQRIEDQLADAMVALSSAIRAGVSLAQALEILADQCPRPINAEFRQIVNEFAMGKPLEQSLTEAKDRLRSENFSLFAAALLASRESGGKLNETVERIAHSVLEMQRLERKVIAETAQARKSAVYMALAPLFILVVYFFVDPENTSRLFTRNVGQFVLAVAIVLNLAAYLWARVILRPDM